MLVPILAGALYVTLSKWNWSETSAAVAREEQMDDLLGQLKAKLAANPNDVNGWLLLGRSYGTMGRYPLAVDAFQNAYDRSQGESVEYKVARAYSRAESRPAFSIASISACKIALPLCTRRL